MKTVSASLFRQQLFQYLNDVDKGEVIVIEKHGRPVGKLVPAGATNWRDGVTATASLRVPTDEAFEPLPDLWETHI